MCMSFFRYPGGKSKLKKNIMGALVKIAEEQQLKEYREPFFGGGSIGLDLIDRYSFSSLWINDKDYGVWCIWKSVCDYPDRFKDAIKNFDIKKYFTKDRAYSFFEKLKDKVQNQTVKEKPEDIVQCALEKLLVHQTSYSGLGTMAGGPIGGRFQKSNYGIGCRWNPDGICKKIQKIHDKVNGRIRCTHDSFEVVVSDGRALVYLDPPYYQKGSELYQCSFTIENHLALMNCLRKSDHEWVLSYDKCDEIEKLYSWAHIEYFKANYVINASTKKCEDGKVILDDNGCEKIFANEKTELLIFPAKYKEKQLVTKG